MLMLGNTSMEWQTRIIEEKRKANSYVSKLLEPMSYAFANGATLFLCGNGGSMSDALHFSGELLKDFEIRRPQNQKIVPAFPVVVLGLNHALNTSWVNDGHSPELLFAQELYNISSPGDMVMGFSTSGTSANVLTALEYAHTDLDVDAILMTGKRNYDLPEDILQIAVADDKEQNLTPAMIQERQIVVYHCLARSLERIFYAI